MSHYQEMKKATKPPVDLNVLKAVRIKTKHCGLVDIYTIKPCKVYSQIELMLASKNNPTSIIYDDKHDCFYVNYFGYTYLSHASDGRFYSLFLEAMKKGDVGADYLDACKKYLRRYADLQKDVSDMYE